MTLSRYQIFLPYVLSDGKSPPTMQEIQVWSLGWKDPPGEKNEYPLQYSCLENSVDRGAWRIIGHGVCKESEVTEWITLHFLLVSAINMEDFCAQSTLFIALSTEDRDKVSVSLASEIVTPKGT